MRGEAFQPDHWATLFRKLGLESSLKIDKLCLSHFLDSAELLVEHAEEVRQLDARRTLTPALTQPELAPALAPALPPPPAPTLAP